MYTFEINPYIRIATHSTLITNINMRILLDYELLYIEDGILCLNYNGTSFRFKRGDILLLCPGIPHSFTLLTPAVVQPLIHFDLTYDPLSLRRFICFRNHSELSADEKKMIQTNAFPQLIHTPLLSIKKAKAFLDIFFGIINSNNYHDLLCKSQMLQLLNMIISENAQDAFRSDTSTQTIVSFVKNYIDSNYEKNFQLADLEKQFCYSRFYMDRKFKQEIGISIIQYRNQVRMLQAIPLLQKYTITQTAQMLGFSSIYAFSRAFRDFYQDSPSEYRKKEHP